MVSVYKSPYDSSLYCKAFEDLRRYSFLELILVQLYEYYAKHNN